MTNHKFEPFEKVLVRNRNFHPWEPMLYGYPKDSEHVCAGVPYSQCIPYTPETAHILGTAQPYEPPKPPVEYEWGQKVQVLRNGQLIAGLYVGKAQDGEYHILLSTQILASVPVEAIIRPLPDSA